MNTSALIMMIVGFVGLWGAFGICVAIAIKRSKNEGVGEAFEA